MRFSLSFLLIVFLGCVAVAHTPQPPAIYATQAKVDVPDYVNAYSEKITDRAGNTFYMLPVYSTYLTAAMMLKRDPDVIKNNFGNSACLLSPFAARRIIKSSMRSWASFAAKRAKDEYQFVPLRYVIVGSDGQAIGECGLQSGKEGCSIYYNLFPAARGKGIASRAARKLVQVFFRLFPEENELFCYFLEGNASSRFVAQKADMTPHMIGGSVKKEKIEGRLFEYYSISRKKASKLKK